MNSWASGSLESLIKPKVKQEEKMKQPAKLEKIKEVEEVTPIIKEEVK